MTSRTRVVSRGKVFLRTSRTNLAFLRQAARRVVTVIAVQTLSRRVVRVAKRIVIGGRSRRCGRISLRFVTHAARSEVASVGLRVRRVTGVTAVMRTDSGGNRQRGAASQTTAVATGTAAFRSRRARQMLRMIEFHVEALFESIRKSFARRIIAIHVLVTDRAHGDVWRRELGQMTSRARFVSRETRPGGIVSAPVTIVAAERCVFRTGVEKF